MTLDSGRKSFFRAMDDHFFTMFPAVGCSTKLAKELSLSHLNPGIGDRDRTIMLN